jgi:hypothetical protein
VTTITAFSSLINFVFSQKFAQKSGKLDAFIEKRRRKNAAKDHRFMPYRRSNDSEQ